MFSRIVSLGALALLVAVVAAPAVAQDGPDAHTAYVLNMRAGPGVDYAVLAVLQPGTALELEARNGDTSWVLARTEDGATRGWVAGLYLNYRPGISPARLPVSSEVMAAAPAVAVNVSPETGQEPATTNPIAGTLETMPVVPAIGGAVRSIFQRGQALGNYANVFAKVGECNTLSYAFMVPFASGKYDLGPYSSLQQTIDFFTPQSFGDESMASRAGFTSAMVVDAAWSDPGRCPPGLSPLECELDRIRPSVVLVNLGMHDVHSLSPQQYREAIQRIIDISVGRGVIPVLATFPIFPGNDIRTAARYEFNAILIGLAQQNGVPLINFWRAAEALPHRGVGDDHVHLTHNADQSALFNGEENLYGFTMLNLITLQTLDELRRTVLSP